MKATRRPLRILRSQDQETIILLIGAALLLLLGSSMRDMLVAHPTVNYATGVHRPIAYGVQLNVATWPELAQLPGVGETLARRIVELREREGPFRSLSELRRVQGVGHNTLARISKYLEIRAAAEQL